jgi:2-hydroxy-3-keto-5-methylthiopentenyl-1-phosphate phosphatase
MTGVLQRMKKVIQCDFDGTLTIGEVSRLLLEEFAEGDWQKLTKDYIDGKISVQDCNIKQFAMVKSDKKTIIDFLTNSGRVEIRPGFYELFEYLTREGFDVVIVSNGLRLYIETILHDLGIERVDVYAARSWFSPYGVEITYPGPDGTHITDGFKEFYSRLLREKGYDLMYYVGNGDSDIYPARYADHIFATDGLLECCRREKLPYTPFNDLFDVIRGIESIS